MTKNVTEINRLLKQHYGDDLTGRPRFRVVWADGEVEKQFGEFEDYYGNIFLRRYTGVREVKKYPWIGQKWILEKLMVNPAPDTIVGAAYTYECIFVFQNANAEYLPPVFEVAKIVIDTLLYGTPMTKGQRESQDAQALAKEIEFFEDYIGGDYSDLAFALRHGEAVAVPGEVKSDS